MRRLATSSFTSLMRGIALVVCVLFLAVACLEVPLTALTGAPANEGAGQEEGEETGEKAEKAEKAGEKLTWLRRVPAVKIVTQDSVDGPADGHATPGKGQPSSALRSVPQRC